MTTKSPVKTVSLLAVVLLSVPAFAGTATYLGTHDASYVRLDGTSVFSPADVTYAGGTINLSSSTAGFSGAQLPDESNNAITLSGDGVYTCVIDSVDIGTMTAGQDFVGFGLDEPLLISSQPFFGITPDGAGGLNASFGIGTTSSLPSTGPGNIFFGPITLPATVVMTKTGTLLSITIDGVPFGTPAILASALIEYAPRIWDTGPGDPTISFTSIEVVSVGTVDVNQPPVPRATITQDGAIDEAFVSGSATWSVEFDDDVQFVGDGDFEIVDGGDAAHTTGPTVTANSASSYTVAVGGVTGAAGSVHLNFLGPGTPDGSPVESISSGELAPAVNGPQYTNLPLPAATNWALVLLALTLSFAAAVMIRRHALKQ